jgi:hypothetical protein
MDGVDARHSALMSLDGTDRDGLRDKSGEVLVVDLELGVVAGDSQDGYLQFKEKNETLNLERQMKPDGSMVRPPTGSS